jgi:hypothetical protein
MKVGTHLDGEGISPQQVQETANLGDPKKKEVKKRPAIPTKTRQKVLSEFNHRCAICGADRPHLHHIDEDPTHNDLLNLVPLCPNCHLIDQHNPTAQVDPRKLRLFREFKDPTILKSQFEPLFRRCLFLDFIAEDTPPAALQDSVSELVRFVGTLEMGGFYGEQINKLLKRPGNIYVWNMTTGPDSEERAKMVRHVAEYRQQVRDARGAVIALVVELLRYQKW